MIKYILVLGNSLVVQWLILWTFGAEDMGLIPDWGTKIPHAKIIYIYGFFLLFMSIFPNFSITNLYHLHNKNNTVL